MILEKVKAILAEQFDVDEDKIAEDTDLQEDLGADSLDVVDLLMSIEDEFEIEVPDDEIENLVIKENANGFAVVSVPAHQLCEGGYATATRRDNITVDIFLTFEDGALKVSGEDCFEMLFLTDRTASGP